MLKRIAAKLSVSNANIDIPWQYEYQLEETRV